jgi:murein L,D-transpeptidase YcbB/YkuD
MPTGREILAIARRHVGERYVNVLVPKNNPSWKGPWDCAEFASWCVFQVGGFLYGCVDDQGDPATTESYTGAWEHDAKTLGKLISVERAATIAGAAVLRFPPQPGSMGHIAISDGQRGTVEAHSRARGVVADRIDGRRWDTGVLVPGIEYVEAPGASPAPLREPRFVIYRLRTPLMTGAKVKEIQRALKRADFHPGRIDGEYGPLTLAAVAAFQAAKGLVPDGEVGPRTARALGVELPLA